MVRVEDLLGHGATARVGRADAEARDAARLIQDLEVRIATAITGELLSELTVNPDKDYQPRRLK